MSDTQPQENAAPKTEATVNTETSVSPEAEGVVSKEKAPLTQEEQQLLGQSENTIKVGLGQFVAVGIALILISAANCIETTSTRSTITTGKGGT